LACNQKIASSPLFTECSFLLGLKKFIPKQEGKLTARKRAKMVSHITSIEGCLLSSEDVLTRLQVAVPLGLNEAEVARRRAIVGENEFEEEEDEPLHMKILDKVIVHARRHTADYCPSPLSPPSSPLAHEDVPFLSMPGKMECESRTYATMVHLCKLPFPLFRHTHHDPDP
jgi:hypothetical protein